MKHRNKGRGGGGGSEEIADGDLLLMMTLEVPFLGSVQISKYGRLWFAN